MSPLSLLNHSDLYTNTISHLKKQTNKPKDLLLTLYPLFICNLIFCSFCSKIVYAVSNFSPLKPSLTHSKKVTGSQQSIKMLVKGTGGFWTANPKVSFQSSSSMIYFHSVGHSQYPFLFETRLTLGFSGQSSPLVHSFSFTGCSFAGSSPSPQPLTLECPTPQSVVLFFIYSHSL